MKTLLIKNAELLATMDDAGREIKGGDVYIEGPEIKKVGKGLKVKADQVIDAKGCVVMPGMVNTHHHLYQTLTRNLPKVQDAELFDWLVYLYDIWKHVNPEAIYASTQAGLGELLLTGCTTSSDHLYLFPKKDSGFFIDTQIEAARELGIRFTATRGSMSRGRSNGGLPPDSVVQKEDFILKDCERLINKFHGREKFAMTRVAMAPCSPFSVTTELLEITAEMAKKWGVRMHTHLAETKDEEAFCRKLFKMRPLEYMESVGWVEEGNAWFAHCVYINEAEAKKMGRTHTGVAHCPCSNLRLGSGIAPIPMFLKHNVPVGLGVDGSASNDSSDMLGEARQCMLVHRLGDIHAMPARKALELATRGGAAVLGRTDIGSIEPGKAADLAIFDVSGLDYIGSKSDPLASLLFCGASHRTKYTVVNGKIVVKNGRLALVDERRVTERATKAAQSLYRKAGV
ncbi:MAG: 8-oxoguanine deaminase [Elusimicrobia bacterium]|nr:8-oxoguanine deaminase [Elusimicrobiota bacterium]